MIKYFLINYPILMKVITKFFNSIFSSSTNHNSFINFLLLNSTHNMYRHNDSLHKYFSAKNTIFLNSHFVSCSFNYNFFNCVSYSTLIYEECRQWYDEWNQICEYWGLLKYVYWEPEAKGYEYAHDYELFLLVCLIYELA